MPSDDMLGFISVYDARFADALFSQLRRPVMDIQNTGQGISSIGKVPFKDIPKKLIFLRIRVGF